MKNHSMLEDERVSDVDRILKRYRCRYLDGTYAPIGHVYSVMVEVLNIKRPNIGRFIADLNKYIEIGGDGFARIQNPTDQLYSRTFGKLAWYLTDYLKKKKIKKAEREKLFATIMKEASGGYDHYSYLSRR